MKKIMLLTVIGILCLSLLADVPNLINYQGRLADISGDAITGNVSVIFTIYDTETNRTALWTETQSVDVTEGLFQVSLGESTTFPTDLFDGANRWLGINAAGDGEMTPRTKLAAVPYALQAGTSAPDNLGNHTATQNINLNGNRLSGDGDDEGIYIDNGGNVGIGTTYLNYKLRVNGDIKLNSGGKLLLDRTSAADEYAYIEASSPYWAGLKFKTTQTSAGNMQTAMTIHSRNGRVGIGTETPATKLDVTGTVNATSFTGDGSALIGIDDDLGNHTATQNINLNGNRLSGDGDDEGIFVDAEGDVGIGTTSPATKLEVNGTVTATSFSGDGSALTGIADDMGNHTATQNINLNGNRLSGDGDNEGIFVASDGDVGIGTTSPNSDTKLHVAGDDNYAGYFTSDYNSYGTKVIHSEFTGTGNYGAKAVYGKSTPLDSYGYGGYFQGGYAGVSGTVYPTGGLEYYGARGYVSGGSGTNYGIYVYASGGGTNYAGYFAGNLHYVGTLSGPSDRNLKENVQPLGQSLNKLMRMKVHTYNFIAQEEEKQFNLPEGKQMGLIAQELEEIYPELVMDEVHCYDLNEGKEGVEKDVKKLEYKGINYIGLIPVLTKAIQEQQEMIEEQQKQIDELRKLIEK